MATKEEEKGTLEGGLEEYIDTSSCLSMRLSVFGDSLAAEGSDYLGLIFQPKFQQMIG